MTNCVCGHRKDNHTIRGCPFMDSVLDCHSCNCEEFRTAGLFGMFLRAVGWEIVVLDQNKEKSKK